FLQIKQHRFGFAALLHTPRTIVQVRLIKRREGASDEIRKNSQKSRMNSRNGVYDNHFSRCGWNPPCPLRGGLFAEFR
ncbi:hypothetical protein, partial [Burkholderia sp. Bp8986]|uniref:hypothetical protein n=1 Tax=Burkholderia sp. Bp8986 TaxID=2184550 RepID=UPI001C8AFCE0